MSGKSNTSRYQWVDTVRGLAVCLMILYHFCYDLTYFRLYIFDFYNDIFWLGARTLIVSLFLLLVGISIHLSARRGILSQEFIRSFARRLAWLLLCALLVSVSSYYFSPSRWIFFGILHFISVASVLGLLFVTHPKTSLGFGISLIVLGIYGAFPAFDHDYLQWFGLMTHKPMTEDYVPMLPWFGVVLLGLFIGHRCFSVSAQGPCANEMNNPRLNAVGIKWLGFLGRHSLLVYMIHQPIMLGLLALFSGQLL